MSPSATWVSRVNTAVADDGECRASPSEGVTRRAPRVEAGRPSWRHGRQTVSTTSATRGSAAAGLETSQRAGPQPFARLHRAGELFPLAGRQGPQRHGDPVSPGGQDPVEGRLDFRDADNDLDGAGRPQGIDDQLPGVGGFPARHGAQGPVAAGGGNGAGQHRGDLRLVDLDHDPGAGGRRSHPAEVAAGTGRQRGRKVPPGAMVNEGAFPVVQVQARGEAERAAELDLDVLRRGVLGADHVGEDVDVGGQGGTRPPEVLAGPVHDPPAVGLDVHGEVHQQGGCPAERVGADAPVRQLGQERQVRAAELAADDPRGLDRVLAGPGAQGGGGDLLRLRGQWCGHG